MRRAAPAVILFLSCLLPGLAQAQSCPPPVVMLVGGSNPSCAGQPVTLDAGPGWTTYQWSNGGATTRMITVAPSATTPFSVTTTDANGCSVTSQPLTVVVNSASYAPPAIQGTPTDICPSGSGTAWVDTPSPDYTTVTWTIQHGTITTGAASHYVSFDADGSALPVVLSVTVADANGCPAQSSITIPIRTIATPAIHTYEDNVCPTGFGQVYVDLPPAGSWDSIVWTIEHGSLPYGNNSPSASFTADGSGLPVVLHVTVRDYGHCEAQNSITIPIRTIAAPAIHTYETGVCPTGMGQVYVDLPAAGSWDSIVWTIEHGSLPYGNSSPSASFTTDGSGLPVVLHVTVRDYGHCEAQTSITIPVESAPAVSIQSEYSTICVNGYGAATIDPPAPGQMWSSIYWTVDHGSVYWGQGTTRLNFQADGSGNPVVVHVSALQDGSSCPAQSSVTIPTRTLTPPVIALPTGSCVTTASVTNASDYAQFMWSADNASISGSTFDSSVTFHPIQNGHVTLTVVVRDGAGCEATSSIGFDVTGLPDITMTLPGVPYCYGTPATASIPDGGPGVTYQWSLNSGQFLGSSTTPSVTFIPQADTLALTVTATNAQGCSASGTAYILVNRPPFATITASGPTTFCTGGSVTLTAGSAPSYHWSNGATTQSITVSTAVSYTVTASNPNGCGSTSAPTVVTIVDPAVSITADGPLDFCEGSGSVTLTASAGASYLWNTGATTRSIVVTQGGLYRVTVTNADGCSGSYSLIVSPKPAPQAEVWVPNGSTNGCAGQQIQLQALGTGTYLWSTGATTQSIYATQSGNYSVTVTNANGCSATSQPVAIHIDAAQLTPAFSAPAQVCTSATSATITVTNLASFSSIFYMSNATITSSANGVVQLSRAINSGAFYLDAYGTTPSGCQYVGHVDVPQGTGPDATITSPSTVCEGVPVTASVPDAGPGATYHWEVGLGIAVTGTDTRTVSWTPYSFNNNPANLYCAVTNASGCTSVAIKNVTVTPRPPAQISLSPTPFCDSGVYTASTPSAGAGATYHWTIGNGAFDSNDGTNTVTFHQTPSGGLPVYLDVTVTANGCSNLSHATLNALPAPSIAITASGPTTFCAGGSVTLSATSGLSSYLWSNGATTPSIVVTTSGNYTVTAAGANGCSRMSAPTAVVVNAAPQVPVIAASGPTTFCAGGNVTLTAPASFGYSYLWSTGATTQSITVSASGSYSVTVTDASGCSATSAPTVVTVDANPTASITASGPTTFCAGGNVTLTASSGSTYLWSNGATTQAITVSAGGNYSVTVTNASGCSATSAATAVTVTPNPTANITAYGSTTFCAGGNVTLAATSAASYLWSTGETTQSIVVGTSGNYTVTVTNSSGCSTTSAATAVTVNPKPAATITPSGATSFCAGGSVTLTASSGASYLWSTGETTPSIVVSSSGNYSVTVTSAAGCSNTSQPLAVTVNAFPDATITAPSSVCASTYGDNARVPSVFNGSYAWTISGGTITSGAGTYQIAFKPSGSGPVTLGVTVTSPSGCAASSTRVVDVHSVPKPVVTPSGAASFCNSGLLTAPAGYTAYSWTRDGGQISGASASTFLATQSGTYSVIVFDAANCWVESDPVSITVSTTPVASISAQNNVCAGSTYGAVSAGSAASYQWSVTNGTLVDGQGTQVMHYMSGASGNVTLTLTVANAQGCSNTQSIDIPIANVQATITPSGPLTICPGGSVTLTASAGASYIWSNNTYAQSTTITQAGSYSVRVFDGNGCYAQSQSVTVSVASPSATITPSGPTTFCACGSVTLSAPAGYLYSWSSGATTQSIIVNQSNTYTVTVQDGNGCTASSSVAVTVNPVPEVVFSTPSLVCGTSESAQEVQPLGTGLTYDWTITNGAITQNAGHRVYFTANAGATQVVLHVTITGSNGCSASDSITLPVHTPPDATITTSGPTTFCAGGNVTLTAPAGMSSYNWSTGATTQSITVSTPDSYTVTVRDANFCSTQSSPVVVTVNPLPAPTISTSGSTTFCAGGSVTLTAPDGFASYRWNTGATTQSINVSSTGNYSVTVSDGNCSGVSAETPVTVRTLPTATVSGTTAICAGGSATITAALTGTAPWTVNWSDHVTQTINSGATASRTVNPSATTTYTVSSITDANCTGTSSGLATITVNALPTATVSGTAAICPGGSATITAALTGTAPWTITWSDQVTQTINSGTSASRTVNPSATTTYSVSSLTDATCTGTSSGLATITVKTLPTAAVSGGGAICLGGSVTIAATLTGTAPWSVTWSDNITQKINSGTTASRSVSPSATTVYTVTSVSDAGGCPVAGSGSATVTVKTPTATVSGDTAICPGASATITAALTGTAPWHVTWSDNVTQTINSGTTATRSVSPAATTTYTVTSITDASGCAAAAGSGSATVTRNVAASITTQPANKSTTINTNVTVSVVAAGTAPISYQWFKSNGTIITGATSSSYTTSFPAKGNYQFYVEVWNSCNTTHVKSHNVTVTVN